LEKNDRCHHRNIPGSAWAKEETTQRLDLSEHPSEDPNQKTLERSSQLEPHKSPQSGNTSRVHTDLQGSEEEFEEGQN
jgi:hypothetical protein